MHNAFASTIYPNESPEFSNLPINKNQYKLTMKAEVLVGIVIFAAIILLFLVWVIYYAIKAIINCVGKSSNTFHIDGTNISKNTKALDISPITQETRKVSEIRTEIPKPTPEATYEVVNEEKAISTSTVSSKSVLTNSAAITVIIDTKKKISNLQQIHNDRNDWRGPQKIPVCIANTQALILTPSYRKYTVELLRAKCNIIIAVDARPSIQAGYCVNLKQKWIQYYVVKKQDLPWLLKNGNDPDEFEMKNFIFALTIWYEEIVKNQSFQIFTDNNEVWKCDTKYGRRTQKLLNHFVKCEQVRVENVANIHINRMNDIEQFALFLKPADDFSRWKIADAVDFLTKMYGVQMENVKGTHFLKEPASEIRRASYGRTDFYRQVLIKAQQQIKEFETRCLNPSCSKILRESLRGRNQTERNRSLLL